MSGLILALLTCDAAAAAPGWGQLDWGGPLPEDAEEFHDLPWAGVPGERCVERGAYILCGDAAGLKHAHRRLEVAVTEGERTWMHTAGFEWSSGYSVSVPGPEGLRVERWGPRTAPLRAWESAWRVEEPASSPPRVPAVSQPTRSVYILGGAALEGARPAVAEALSRCGGAAVEQLPLALLYDPTGEARMVRVQGFPPDDVDMDCIVEALGAPELHPKGGVIELMVTLGPLSDG